MYGMDTVQWGVIKARSACDLVVTYFLSLPPPLLP